MVKVFSRTGVLKSGYIRSFLPLCDTLSLWVKRSGVNMSWVQNSTFRGRYLFNGFCVDGRRRPVSVTQHPVPTVGSDDSRPSRHDPTRTDPRLSSPPPYMLKRRPLCPVSRDRSRVLGTRKVSKSLTSKTGRETSCVTGLLYEGLT